MPTHNQILLRYREHCQDYWTAGQSDNEWAQSHARARLDEMKFFLVPGTFTNAAFETSEVYRQGEMHHLEKKVEQASGLVLTNEARLHKLRSNKP